MTGVYSKRVKGQYVKKSTETRQSSCLCRKKKSILPDFLDKIFDQGGLRMVGIMAD